MEQDESFDSKIERWDREFSQSTAWKNYMRERKATKSQLASFTHGSLERFLNEIPFSLTKQTLFVDLGSGLGHVLFYVIEYLKKKDPNFLSHIHFLGVEMEHIFVAESQRRLRQLRCPNCNFVERNILETTVADTLEDFQFVILFSFDILFPENVVEHIQKELFDKFPRSIIWLSTVENNRAVPSYERVYMAPPGMTEDSPNAFIIEGSGRSTEDRTVFQKKHAFADFERMLEKPLQQIEQQYIQGMTKRGKPIERNAKGQLIAPFIMIAQFFKEGMEPHAVEVYTIFKQEKNMQLINLCINCFRPSELRCPCHVSYIYCGKQCQRQDYMIKHYKVH